MTEEIKSWKLDLSKTHQKTILLPIVPFELFDDDFDVVPSTFFAPFGLRFLVWNDKRAIINFNPNPRTHKDNSSLPGSVLSSSWWADSPSGVWSRDRRHCRQAHPGHCDATVKYWRYCNSSTWDQCDVRLAANEVEKKNWWEQSLQFTHASNSNDFFETWNFQFFYSRWNLTQFFQ